MQNNIATIHVMLDKQAPGAVYQVSLAGIRDRQDETLDDIEIAIDALMMSITNYAGATASRRGFVLHTRTMSVHHVPNDLFKNTRDIDASITIKKDAIVIHAKTVKGDEWTSILPRNHFSILSSIHTSDTRAYALNLLDKGRLAERSDMMYNINLDESSSPAQKQTSLTHAFLCGVIAYSEEHSVALPHDAVLSYMLHFLSYHNKTALGLDKNETVINRVPLADYFVAEYITWKGLREGRHIKTLDGFKAYKEKFLSSLMSMAQEVAPIAFLIDDDAAHLRHVNMTKEMDANIINPQWEINKDHCHASSHQMMALLQLEERLKAIIDRHHDGLFIGDVA